MKSYAARIRQDVVDGQLISCLSCGGPGLGSRRRDAKCNGDDDQGSASTAISLGRTRGFDVRSCTWKGDYRGSCWNLEGGDTQVSES